MQLEQKRAIITGGTRGIGLAIARRFLAEGAAVTIASRKQDNVDAACRELVEYGHRIHGVAAHVGRPDDVARLVDAAEQAHGPITTLVNNAGTNPYFGPIVESDDAAWQKTMDVNVTGPYRLSRECARRMIGAEGGTIINIASIAGITALPMQGIYSVSKAALIMLTKVLARELGGQGIRVNAILPGLIETKLSEAIWSDPKVKEATTGLKALGRIGQPDELAGAAVYFASDASTFTTGAVLQVDGGMVI